MAKCDGGYFCYHCGEYVENITVSELYLRYVLGEVPYDDLLGTPDGHIRCNQHFAQYIVDDRFEPVVVEEPKLRKENLEPDWVKSEEERVTRAWRHLQALPQSGIPMRQYPLDADGVWRGAADSETDGDDDVADAGRSDDDVADAGRSVEPPAFEC